MHAWGEEKKNRSTIRGNGDGDVNGNFYGEIYGKRDGIRVI